MKFIGHLDVMRYFQKAIRRADLPVAYSEGFSPHMLMSFASPLGVGKTSMGEYFDLDIAEGASISPDEAAAKLQSQMADGISVVGAVEVSMKKADKCMSQVAAADYSVSFRPGKLNLPLDTGKLTAAFLDQPSIEIMRKTKTSQKVTDIRPWIYSFACENSRIEETQQNLNGMNFTEKRPCEKILHGEKAILNGNGRDACSFIFTMKLASGSVHNLKPELVMEAFAVFAGFTIPDYALMIQREEIYGECPDGYLIPLDGFALK